MVLGKKEKALMNVIYHKAIRSQNGQCLVTPLELLKEIPYKLDFKESELDETLNQLVLDHYFECDRAKNPAGDTVYCITLKENGESYLRDRRVSKLRLIRRIIIAVIIAVLSFSLKSILNAIFG